MMTKIFGVFKKYKYAIITALFILIVGVGIGLLFLPRHQEMANIKELNEESYALNYDSTWDIKSKTENEIVLNHGNEGKITIQISTLIDDYRYATIDELIDEVLYTMQQQNPSYHLLAKKKDKITQYEFEGYKILYENETEQVMVTLYKTGDKLILIRYEADNDYFDILLDSVQSIVYHLTIKEDHFELQNNLSLDMVSIAYDENTELDNVLNENKTYTIAKNNYYVEYAIPALFSQRTLDSSLGSFQLKLASGNIDLTVNILNRNLYEYLDKNETSNVYNNYKYYKTSEDYTDFQESLAKLESNYESYIYKNEYYNSLRDEQKEENVELMYALNNSHILIVTIKATGVPATQKLIQQIHINTSRNYASYVKIEKEDNFLIGVLQRFRDYNNKEIDYVKLKVPDKYEEIDKNNNLYLERNYALNYNEDKLFYDYEVHYGLTTLSDEAIIKSINSAYITSAYGEAHELIYTKDLTVNNKKFKVYEGGYTKLSGIMFTNTNREKYYVNKKVLFYEIPERGNLYIEINGNGKGLGDDILEELTNFTIEVKNYE